MTEHEMVRWYHQFNGYEFEQTSGDGDGQGDLAAWSPWGHKELDTTERLNNNNIRSYLTFSVLSQVVNILGFVDHGISVATTQFCYHR